MVFGSRPTSELPGILWIVSSRAFAPFNMQPQSSHHVVVKFLQGLLCGALLIELHKGIGLLVNVFYLTVDLYPPMQSELLLEVYFANAL